ERLMERDAGRLELEKQKLNLGGGRDRDGGREQALAIAPLAIDHRPIDAAQVEPRAVTYDLSVERRFAMDERDRKAELVGEERARCRDVGDEQLRLGGGENRARHGPGSRSLCHGSKSPTWWASLPLRPPYRRARYHEVDACA